MSEQSYQRSKWVNRHKTNGVPAKRLAAIFDKGWSLSLRVGTCVALADALLETYLMGRDEGKAQ